MPSSDPKSGIGILPMISRHHRLEADATLSPTHPCHP